MTQANEGFDAAAEAAYQRAKSEVGALPGNDLIERIEHGGFEGGSGLLVQRLEWQEIKRRVLDGPGSKQADNRADIPQALYDSEINFSISCAFEGGWVIKLGDEDNGWEDEMRIAPPLKFEDALLRLRLLALGRYPDSDFAKRFG